MPNGGAIFIEAKQVTDGDARSLMQLRFRDTGPGIPEQDREKIFAPYFSTKATGFGLGLAITRKIIEDHGGRVYVSSNNHAGAEMIVELPFTGSAMPHAPVLSSSRVA